MRVNLNVLFVSEFIDNPMGGLGRYEQELVKALPESGLDALTVARLAPGLTTSTHPVWRGVSTMVQAATGGRIRWRLTDLPDHLDVVHFSNQQMGGAISGFKTAQLMGLRPDAKVIVMIHDLYDDMAIRSTSLADIAPHRSWRSGIGARLNRYGLRRADHFVVNSHATAKDVQTVLGVEQQRITVAHLGVDHHMPRLDVRTNVAARTLISRRWDLDPNTDVILYVGSLHPRKNVTVLLPAIAELRRRGVPATLVIAGSTRSTNEPQALDEAVARGHVHLLGHVSDQELSDLYAGAQVFAFPSRFEGFGFPVLEAMGQRVPVVASNCPIMQEVIGDAGLLVAPLAPFAWADALQRVLQEPDLRKRFVERGCKRFLAFTWRRTAENTLQAYAEAMRSGSRTTVAAVRGKS